MTSAVVVTIAVVTSAVDCVGWTKWGGGHQNDLDKNKIIKYISIPFSHFISSSRVLLCFPPPAWLGAGGSERGLHLSELVTLSLMMVPGHHLDVEEVRILLRMTRVILSRILVLQSLS